MRQDPTAPGPTADAVRAGIGEERRRRSLGAGLATLLPAAAVWALTLAGVALLPPWWARVPLAVVNGIAIGVLFLCGHDAGHGALLPRRWMNRLAGRLCLLPALHPFAAWVHNHNGLHHGFTNIKEKDPGFPPLTLAEYRALPAWRRGVYRVGRTWYGLGLLYFVEMWVKWEMFPAAPRAPRNRAAFRRDRAVVAAFAVAWVGLLATAAVGQGTSAVALVLVGFALPQAVWNWTIGFVIFQQHTHPEVPWYSALDGPAPSYFQAQVRATPHVILPAPYRFLMRHIMEHTAHHADPSVPLYRLEEAQRALESTYKEDILLVRWKPARFFRTFRVCRLYDYAAHRWVDYDGTPLTRPLLPPRATPGGIDALADRAA